MYEHHAAFEDTIVFPAWKATLTAKQLDEMGDKFEEIEPQQFGKDGYENAVKQIGDIEGTLVLAILQNSPRHHLQLNPSQARRGEVMTSESQNDKESA